METQNIKATRGRWSLTAKGVLPLSEELASFSDRVAGLIRVEVARDGKPVPARELVGLDRALKSREELDREGKFLEPLAEHKEVPSTICIDNDEDGFLLFASGSLTKARTWHGYMSLTGSESWERVLITLAGWLASADTSTIEERVEDAEKRKLLADQRWARKRLAENRARIKQGLDPLPTTKGVKARTTPYEPDPFFSASNLEPELVARVRAGLACGVKARRKSNAIIWGVSEEYLESLESKGQ